MANIGIYLLPGGVKDPREAIGQAKTAESLGLGTVWIGERFDTKDLPSIAGAVSQTTTSIQIGAAITPMNIRHPMVLASMGQTLQSLSNGRFTLGFGRSADWRWKNYGLTPPTLVSMGDVADILRKLWAGETVSYSGPAGDFPNLKLQQFVENPPPKLLLAAVGPKTLALAGAKFDGAILHPFLSVEAVERSAKIVREAAEKAGKDPASVRIVSTLVTAAGLSHQEAELAIRARGAGYFQVNGLGDALVKMNGWDIGDLAQYRNHPQITALGGKPIDKYLSRQELIELSYTMPEHWIPSTSVSGSARECALKIEEYQSVCDDILIHGSTAEQIGPLMEAFPV